MANAASVGAVTGGSMSGAVADAAEVNIDDDEEVEEKAEITSSNSSSVLGKRSHQESSLSATAPDNEEAIDIDDI